ncbi:glycosyltransferase involved in cell wall biosynthesis [Rhizobium sp. BK650]|uniref:glycosyltransferase family 4 protein n=1 Tax=Rhizobium sp. BK650 TaxID=2586990 RepID=UPI001823B375|nr:glycosyltransferase family 4 protein [Rhizobium sp. BK650]MBB3659797.1 glycosyltransferase involved in cell wall biosynthesis [Rhizobium sp. BK650]
MKRDQLADGGLMPVNLQRIGARSRNLLSPSIDGKVSSSAMRKLRILHLLFADEIAGSERHCIDLANGQAALGHEVHVAGYRRSPIIPLLGDNVIFHGFSTALLRGMRLRRLIARAGIEVAHAHHSPGSKALATVSSAVTTIATLHVGYRPKRHARMDGVICVNRDQLSHLNGYAGQAGLIPNWLPDATGEEAVDLRSELDLPRETRLVGAVGRLHPSKGNDVLIEAFRQSAPENAALVIIGEGPQRGELEKMAAGDGRIRLPGYTDNVPGFLSNLDLFVSPSREETFGLAILEAMREGLPIIATATKGPSEYLHRHPVTLVQPGSVDDMSAALTDALKPHGTVGQGRLAYDLSAFSRSTGIANVLEFYREVAARKGTRMNAPPRRP